MADQQPSLQVPTDGKKEPVDKNKKLKTTKVKDIISKGKTILGSPVDQININPVQEAAAEKHAVFAFGRFNPPTIGHEKLIHKVENTAKEVGGQAHIIASHSEGTGKNPLPKEKKVEYLKKVAAPETHVSHSTKEHPTLLHHLSNLHKSGVKHITIVSDKEKEFGDLAHKYNGVEGKHGHFKFKSINSISSGMRDPDAEGAEGMSGTKMRSIARTGKVSEFKKGLPKSLHPHAKEIMGHIKSINEELSLDEEFEFFMFAESVNAAGSGHVRGMGYVSGEVTGDNSTMTTYAITNSIQTDTKDNIMKLVKQHGTLHDKSVKVTKESVNDINTDPKHREAVSRSGQDPKQKQLVPRNKKDRKNDDRPYRHQSLIKKVIDEAKKSAWEKMLAKNPKHAESERRAQEAKAALQQAGKDYQAILDKEAKKDVKESTTTSNIPVWEKPGPKGKSKKLTAAQIVKAKARARAAGRSYPNLVDNMAVMKEEDKK